MKINIQYFAILRDQRGLSSEVHVTEVKNVKQLYQELQDVHFLKIPQDSLKVAINDEFAEWSSYINDGDKIVFIPPVAGG